MLFEQTGILLLNGNENTSKNLFKDNHLSFFFILKSSLDIGGHPDQGRAFYTPASTRQAVFQENSSQDFLLHYGHKPPTEFFFIITVPLELDFYNKEACKSMTIVNRKRGFIFLKTYKTASTSLEIFLITRTKLGDDIYETSRDILKHGRPKSSLEIPLLRGQTNYWTGTPRLLRSFVRKLRLNIEQHSPAARIKSFVGNDFWSSAYKVAPVRNPWDMIISRYEWDRAGRNGRGAPLTLDWNEWLDIHLSKPNQLDSFLMADHCTLAIDGFILFEDIDNSIAEISKSLDVEIPSFYSAGIAEKRMQRKRDYRHYYSDEQAEDVATYHANLLSHVDYQFDGVGKGPS